MDPDVIARAIIDGPLLRRRLCSLLQEYDELFEIALRREDDLCFDLRAMRFCAEGDSALSETTGKVRLLVRTIATVRVIMLGGCDVSIPQVYSDY